MEYFNVKRVIDGDTFEVDPTWVWDKREGNRVRIAGFDAPERRRPGAKAATDRLTRLIQGKRVGLGTVQRIHGNRLVCDVFVGQSNLVSLLQRA